MEQATQLILAIGFLLNVFIGLITAIHTIRNGKKSDRIEAQQADIQENVATLEKNTNSIKDALVLSVAKANLAEGTAIGLEQGRNEQRR